MFGLSIIVSCGPKEYQTIPLENLDPKLKRTGNTAARDILISINHEDGARYLLRKDYVTPMVHGRIMQNLEMYNESYGMVAATIGKVSKYTLFQVINRGIVKTMRYKLTTDSEYTEKVELMLDINNTYGLADYYLYVTTVDGVLERKNVLPRVIK